MRIWFNMETAFQILPLLIWDNSSFSFSKNIFMNIYLYTNTFIYQYVMDLLICIYIVIQNLCLNTYFIFLCIFI